MKRLLAGLIVVLLFSMDGWSKDLTGTSTHLWKTQKDECYLQESSSKLLTEKPVSALAFANNQCYVLMDGMLFLLSEEKLNQSQGAPKKISAIKSLENKLWVLSQEGLFKFDGQKWEMLDGRVFRDLCLHEGAILAATQDEIFRIDGNRLVSIKPEGGYYTSDITMVQEDGSQINDTPVEIGPILKLASHSGNLFILRPGELVLFDGKTVNRDHLDWGRLPSRQVHDLVSMGSKLMISTDKGLGLMRGASLKVLTGDQGLPVEQTTCLARGFADDLWIGSTKGAIRMVSENEWHFFGPGIWLPSEKVNCIAAGNSTVYIGTDAGIGIIRYEPYTLLKKAAYYERHIEEWGHKRLGFIHNLYRKNGEWIREVSDNDGGHTAPYLAAMCYKYACTGDETARLEAIESARAMMWLGKITGVNGFIARSIWSATADKDERGKQGSGGLPAKWYPTPDGKWFWKGDTSSDEVTAHFYALALFYELVAQGKDKEMAKEQIRQMASYIIDCGWTMKDLDGKPTRWARWNPEYLLRPYGYSDKGLNGLEVLSFMETAYALTGDKKFSEGTRQLVKWGYPQNTIRQKNVFPPETLAPWDDHLAFWSYDNLLRYVKDPILKAIYLRSLDRTWEIKRISHVPWYNFIYGLYTGNDCEEEKSVAHLREFPLDCTANGFINSQRDDLFPEAGYSSYEGGRKSLSPRETSINQDGQSPTELDRFTNGSHVTNPSGFLVDYWMARYYGFIAAPSVTDPSLLSVEKRPGRHVGAEPYNGPARPAL
ncbi:MAG: hypothetical protein LWW85_00220 [Marinilabiliales bacterium]|nr:hypothetical protein [Marinilabiliales bacterium]